MRVTVTMRRGWQLRSWVCTVGLAVYTNFILLRTDAASPTYIFLEPSSIYEDLEGDDSPRYSSAFEEANASFSDFESQTLHIYQLYCHQRCPQDEDYRPNVYCDRCYCDNVCHYYDDCCPGVKKLPIDSTNIGCETTLFPDRVRNISAVAYCPTDYKDREIQALCRTHRIDHWRFTQLVTDMITGVVYRNKYCSQCHGILDAEPWELDVVCIDGLPNFTNPSSELQTYRDIIGKIGCSIQYVPPENTVPHECESSLDIVTITKCNQTGLWIKYDPFLERGCEELPYNVVRYHKNIFCYMCNTYYSWEYIKQDTIRYDPVPFSIALSSLLDLRDDGPNMDESVVTDEACPPQSLEDPYKCTCRSISCVNGKYYEDGECVSIFKSTDLISFVVCMAAEIRFHPNTTSSKDTLIFKDVLINNIANLKGKVAFLETGLRYLSPCSEKMVMRAEMNFTIYFREPVKISEFEKQFLSSVPKWSLANKGMSIDFWLKGSCGEPMTKYIVNDDLTIPCIDYLVPSSLDVRLPDDYVEKFFESEMVRLNKVYTCPSIVLHDDDISISKDKQTLMILANNRSLDDFDFQPSIDGGYLVCINDYLELNTKQDDMYCHNNKSSARKSVSKPSITALGLLSGVCTSLSLFFLVVMLAIFGLLKKYRTSTGTTIIALAVTLFIAQALFEFGMEQVEIKWVCETIGILTHFFWLSAIFWMNVCTVILFYKLTYPIESRNISTRKLMVCSFLYTWGCPLMIVTAVAVGSYLTNGRLGYGGKSCYITTATSRRFAFALPVGLLVVINVVLFAFTFIKLRRESKLQSNQENQISMLACLKLSVITGLTWIFAFVYEATGYEVFAYLFTLLVGAQGVILFLVFTGNKNTMQELKELYSKEIRGRTKEGRKTGIVITRTSNDSSEDHSQNPIASVELSGEQQKP